jgi:uncharacterized protein YciI
MKYVIYYGPATDMGKARALFAEHRAKWDAYRKDGTLLMIGPFANPEEGAMGVFTTREAAQAFIDEDPFVTQGVVSFWKISEWNEAIA